MTDHWKRYDGIFKAKVVLESPKNERPSPNWHVTAASIPTRSSNGGSRL